MKELKNIIAAYQNTDFQKNSAVLATVLEVKGSSYRSPGAKMYITDDGKWVGTISGGCLEGDALRKARSVMRTQEAKVVTYDTMDDENNSLGVSLGCNGIIDVLLEPFNSENDPIKVLRKTEKFNNISGIATVFNSNDETFKVGQRILIDHLGEIYINQNEKLNSLVYNDLNEIILKKRPGINTYFTQSGSIDVFLEIIEPNIDLMIFGGGFDAQPVSKFANGLGWNVRVIDECIAHLVPINFPTANELQSCNREFIHENVKINPYSAAVLMSHNYHYDLKALKHLIKSDIRYIGILGPKKKLDKMLAQLRDEGYQLTDDDLSRIFGPIGLDIGAESPEEIALSILTEIKSVFSNRNGGFLKERKGHIHYKASLPDNLLSA